MSEQFDVRKQYSERFINWANEVDPLLLGNVLARSFLRATPALASKRIRVHNIAEMRNNLIAVTRIVNTLRAHKQWEHGNFSNLKMYDIVFVGSSSAAETEEFHKALRFSVDMCKRTRDRTDNMIKMLEACGNVMKWIAKPDNGFAIQAEFIDLDIGHVTATGSAFSVPLYHDRPVPSGVERATQNFLGALGRDTLIEPWRAWYLGYLKGRPFETSYEALLEKSPAANVQGDALNSSSPSTASLLSHGKQLAERLPYAERIIFDDATGKFTTTSQEIEVPSLYRAMLSRLSDALNDVLSVKSNSLSDTDAVPRIIKRTVDKYADDPQRVEVDLVSAHRILVYQLANGDLPPSEDLLHLRIAIEEAALGIRATHPDIAEARIKINQARFEGLNTDEKMSLAQALPILKAISDTDLSQQWDEDIPALINDSVSPEPNTAPKLPAPDITTIVFSRVGKIGVAMQLKDVVKVVEESSGYRAVEITITIASLIALGLSLI